MHTFKYTANRNSHPDKKSIRSYGKIRKGDTVVFGGARAFNVVVKAVGFNKLGKKLVAKSLFGRVDFDNTHPKGVIKYDLALLRGWKKRLASGDLKWGYFELHNPKYVPKGGTPPKIPPG